MISVKYSSLGGCFRKFKKNAHVKCNQHRKPQLLNVFALNHFRVVTVSCRSSRPEAFLEKGVLKICSKFTGKHPCRSVISIKLWNFIETTLRHGCSPVNFLHIFNALFLQNTSKWLLLELLLCSFWIFYF